MFAAADQNLNRNYLLEGNENGVTEFREQTENAWTIRGEQANKESSLEVTETTKYTRQKQARWRLRTNHGAYLDDSSISTHPNSNMATGGLEIKKRLSLSVQAPRSA